MPYQLRPSRGSVIDAVNDFGIDPTGHTDSTAKVQAALDAASGGQLYFPAGTYTFGKVTCSSNQVISGDGPATVLKKINSAGMFYIVNDVHDVRFTGISFDLNRRANYDAAIVSTRRDPNNPDPFTNDPVPPSVSSPSFIWIDHCHFFTSVPAVDFDTLHATLILGGVRGVWITDNRTVGTQIKVSEGSRGCGPGVFIERNHCEDSHNFGISVVASFNGINPNDPDDSERDLQTDIHINHNTIVRPFSGGIFVGSDDNINAKGDTRRLSVCHNTIIGPTPLGIIARVGKMAEDWDVSNNIVRNPDGAPPNNSIGIYIANAETSGGVLKQCTVNENKVTNFDQYGVAVVGQIDGLIVAENVLRATRGMEVVATETGIKSAAVNGNEILGGNTVLLQAAANSHLEVRGTGNIVRNCELSCFTVQADAGSTIDVDLSLNRAGERAGFTPGNPFNTSYGIEESGLGAIVSRYALNDLRGNRDGALHVGNSAELIDNRT